MKTTFLKKTLAFIITIALTLSLAPTFVFAAEGDPYVLKFNSSTITNTTGAIKNWTVSSDAGWMMYNGSTNFGTASTSRGVDANALTYSPYCSCGNGHDMVWLKCTSSANRNLVRFEIYAKDVKEGWYDIEFDGGTGHAGGGAIYIYVDAKYAGYYNCDNTGTDFQSVKKLNRLYLDPTDDKDGDGEKDEITIQFARVSGVSGTAQALMFKSITLTPVTTAPTARTIALNAGGEVVAEDASITIANGQNVNITANALLDGEAVNYSGYTSGAATDTASLAVSVTSGDSVTFAESRDLYTDEVLNGTLTATKTGTSTLTLTATYSDGSTATRNVTVNVARSATDPIKLKFNSSTITNATGAIKNWTVSSDAGWMMYNGSTNFGTASTSRGVDANALTYSPYCSCGNGHDMVWLKCTSSANRNLVRFEIYAKDVKEGWYDIEFDGGTGHAGGGAIYIYVDHKYAGYYNCDNTDNGFTSVKKLNRLYLDPTDDKDSDGETDEITIQFARVSGVSGSAQALMFKSITLTPVTTAPTSRAIALTADGEVVAEDASITIANGEILNITANALLDGEAVNYSGYTSGAAMDTASLAVSVISGDSVTFAENRDLYTDEVLNGTLTAVGTGTSTLALTATYSDGSTATRNVTVTVPADEDEQFGEEFGEGTYETDSTPAFTAPTEGKATTTVNTYTTVIGGTDSTATPHTVNLGEEFSITADEKDSAGNVFRYWALGLSENKKVLTRDRTLKFMPTVEIKHVIAVYEQETGATVVGESFYNANGQLLDVAIVDDKMPTLPSMTGYGTASAWVQYGTNKEFAEGADAPDSNRMFVAKYGEPTTTFDIDVVDGTGEGSYTYGQKVTCVATVPEGKVFKCWTKTPVGGTAKIISLDAEYTFNAWEDCKLTAVFADEAPVFTGNKFSIILSAMGTVDNNTAYMAEFVGLGDAVEKGIMFGTKRVAMTTDAAQFTVVNDIDGVADANVTGYAILSDGTVIYDK